MDKSRHFSRSMGLWLMLLLVMLTSLSTKAAEAYACYTSSNTTLTFYCDFERASRPGTTYDLNKGSNKPGWYDDGTRSSVTQVVFDPSFAAAKPTTTCSWFQAMPKLESISGMEYLNTEEVTNMSYMFNQCIYLSSLDLSHFNTAKVTDMTRMFDYCTQLFLVYVGSAWNTDAVTQSSYMFSDCKKLKGGQGTYFSSNNPKDKTYAHIDGGPSNPGYFRDYSISEPYTIYTEDNQTLTFYYDTNRLTRPGTTYDIFPYAGWINRYLSVKYVVFDQSFELAKPTSTSSWFSEMGSLESITGIRYLKTDSVTDMSYMFFECGLSDLEMNNYLSYFNTAKVKRMEWMFHSCKALTTLDLTNFNTANVTDMSYMFDGCNDLTTIYVGDGWSNESVTNSEKMFMYCLSLVGGQGTTFDYDHVDGSYAHIDGGPSNPGYFTAPIVPSEPDAYACFTPSNTTLTFYYDNKRTTRPGTTYDLNTGEDAPGWYNDLLVVEDAITTTMPVTRVVFNSSFAGARPTSTAGWFEDMDKLHSITGIEYLNTEDVTTMYSMFDGCSGLTALDVSHFNTANVTNMAYMFAECKNLTSLDVSNFNTANVNNMRNMFAECSGLTSLNLSSFNTANVTDMGAMFEGCWGLPSLDLSGFNTANVADMNCMFAGCNMTSFDLSHFNTMNVIDMSRMFIFCDNLASVDLSNFNTANVTDMWGMFSDCPHLTSLDLSSFNTAKVTNMVCMFDGCNKLKTIGVSNEWSTDAVTSSGMMFNNCTSLVGGMGTTWDAGHTDAEYARIDGGPSNPGYFTERSPEAYACYTPDNTTLTFYYDSHRSNRPGMTYALNEGTNMPAWYNDHTYSSVTQVVFDPSFAAARPISTLMWFRDMENLTTITGISYLNTSNVTNMQSMFLGCNHLTSIDVSGFNTSAATSIAGMFGGCSALTSLDLSNFNTTGVTTMIGMFKGCSGLTRLGLSNFNTANVTSMMQMFADCTGLTRLDLGNFNTAKVANMSYMFSGCTNLTTIYVGDDWSTAAVTSSSSMFTDCTSLVGGMGTTYNASHVSKEYAHIDGGPRNPGYFTEKHESYAVLTQDDGTLTFFFDTLRSTRPGMTFDTEDPGNGMDWMRYSDIITRVVFDPSFADARPTSTAVWFSNLSHLTSIIGMEYLNTSDVTSMASMFWYCSALTSLDLSSFNTANVINMYCMFYGCTNLSTIYVGDGWSTDAVIWSDEMFNGCTSLVGGKGTAYDANHIDVEYAHIDGGPSNPGYFSEKGPEAYACYTSSNMTLTFYYDDQRSSRPGTAYDLNEYHDSPDWHNDGSYMFVTRTVFDPSFAEARPRSTCMWFCDMGNLQSITGMEYLNTEQVTDMAMMFMGCRKLSSLDLSHFNTSNVTDMSLMFEACHGLTILDVSHFNTSNVTDMSLMFENCHGLTSLDLSSFNTDNVTTMDCMFAYSTGLTSVDLSSFTNARVSRTSNMFEGCSALTTIYASSSWYLPSNNYSWAMFMDCTSLVGGMGTTYDENYMDASRAHIDGGPSNPGYFTAKAGGLRGDVNGDGNVNISDVTALINYLLSHNATGLNLQDANCNQDSTINISDVTALINYLLSHSW